MPFVYSLCSSSKGNATYIGEKEHGILVDCGLSLRQFTRQLSFHCIEPSAVQAIFITHEHSDHIRGLTSIASLLKVPIYGSRETLEWLIRREYIPAGTTVHEINRKTAEIGDFCVNAFTTPHDSAHSLGYRIRFGNGHSACMCTDLGCVTQEVFDNLRGSNFVLLESNYDETMLETGSYPWFLKRRIFSENGHLSNSDCAQALLDLFGEGTTRFLLGHLSEQNNRPELAMQASLQALTKTGAVLGEDYQLSVAKRQSLGEIIDV